MHATRMVGRELDVAMELIGEVFSVGGDEVKRMIKERMARKGHDQGSRSQKGPRGEIRMRPKKETTRMPSKPRKPSRKRAKDEPDSDEEAE